MDRIIARSPGRDVLDVGIGTGIAARQFLTAGCTVSGVDVDERMAELAREAGFRTDVARFEAWDPAGRSFDAVIAGQAWHWVDPVVGALKAAQVLRPAGRLAPFWNVFRPPPEIASAFAEIYGRVQAEALSIAWTRPTLDLYGPIFEKTADGMRQAGAFSAPEQWRFDWDQPYTRDEWLDQVPTHGQATRLPPEALGELLTGIGAALDAAGGGFTMHYTTVTVTAARHGAA